MGADFGVPIGGLMMEQYLTGKLSPSAEAQAAAMQKRRIGYGPRFPGQEKAKAAKKKAEAKKKAKETAEKDSKDNNVPEAIAKPSEGNAVAP